MFLIYQHALRIYAQKFLEDTKHNHEYFHFNEMFANKIVSICHQFKPHFFNPYLKKKYVFCKISFPLTPRITKKKISHTLAF